MKSVLGNNELDGWVCDCNNDGWGLTDQERRLMWKIDGFVAGERTSLMCLSLLKRNLLEETNFRRKKSISLNTCLSFLKEKGSLAKTDNPSTQPRPPPGLSSLPTSSRSQN